MGKVAKIKDVQEPTTISHAPAPAVPPSVIAQVQMDQQWLSMVRELALTPNVNIDAVKAVLELRKEERKQAAEQAFNAAMARVQKKLKPVKRGSYNEQTKKRYADLTALIEMTSSIITDEGLSFSAHEAESKKTAHVGVAVEILHEAGHKKEYHFDVPFDAGGFKGAPNKTQTHAYGSSLTYGRRYAYAAIFNLATFDDDGNAAGKATEPVRTITDNQVEEIVEELKVTKISVDSFLKVFKVECVPDLPADKFQEAMDRFDKRRKDLGLPKRQPKEETPDAA